MRGRYAKKRAERLTRKAVEMLGQEPDRWGVTKTGRPINLTRAEMKLRNFGQLYGSKGTVVRRLAKGDKP